MTPLAWTANLVLWLVTGLIWYKIFHKDSCGAASCPAVEGPGVG
jgi:hypothetical protein